MAIKCPKCQHENPDDTLYCGKCAAPLKPTSDVAVTETIEIPKDELVRGILFANRYEIIEELGSGGMGRVYRAYDKELGEEVAIKLIKSEIAADKKTLDRFKNEIKLARKVIHRNVCRMHDLHEEKDTKFVTMEYVAGEDLKSQLRRMGKVPVEKAVFIAHQIAEGLAEAHRLGVIHRDLKPHNVMIDKEGNARIMDFGIARSLEAKGITGAGMIIGTPEYMSPEQVEGKETDQRSDIYSLGVILYEMVTGRVPFEGDTPLSIAMKHKGEKPKAPQDLNPQTPEDISHLILKCIEKDKKNRYQSAEELLSELGKIEKATSKRILAEIEPETEELKWHNSIAVLPFVDLSPEKDQEYFCDGMAEELINALTKIEKLRVASRTSSFQFKEKGYDIHDVGRNLKVKTVLEGSIRKAGNRLRITAQLINVDDGYHLWSEKYDRKMEDIFAIQDEISLAIVDKLKVKLLAEERKAFVKHYTENPEAYNLYLKGNYFVRKAHMEEMQKGLEYFQKAIEIDPNFAPAYVGISEIFSISGIMTMVSPRDTLPKAKEPLMKALKIDDALDEAHGVSAIINFYYDWSWSEAEKGFKKAISLNPRNAFIRCWYAWYLLAMLRFDESILEIQKAQELDPLVPVYYGGAICMYDCAGRFDDAIEQFHKAIEIDPNFAYAYFHLGRVYALKSRYKEALSCFQKCLDLSEEFPWAEGYNGYIYAVTGQRNRAEQILNKLIEQKETRYITSWSIALLYLGLGQKDEAFAWLEKAYDERDTMMPIINALSDLDDLRSDLRFDALLKKMKLKE